METGALALLVIDREKIGLGCVRLVHIGTYPALGV